ncbi:MAG: BACON domain-containing protein [Mediterranea sp.]|jgi:hypothetical protein|nr:BACON domain-containing protein [Mediterranea sp.]
MNKRNWLRVATILLPAMLLGACISDLSDSPVVKETPSVNVTLAVSMPSDVPTRTLSESDEQSISTVDLLLFRSNGNSRVYYNHIVGTPAAGNTFTALIPTNDYNNFDIHVLVNAHDLVASAPFDTDDTEQQTLNKLVKTLSAGAKWSSSTIPLWGEIANQTLTNSLDLTGTNAVRVTRMLARIDVKLSEEAAGSGNSNFALSSIRLYNYSTSGTVVPDLTNNWDADNHTVTAATEPSSGYGKVVYAKGADNSSTGPLLYNSDDDTAGMLPDSLLRTLYTFESPTGGALARSTNTCLVIGGSYQGGTETFYRADFRVKSGDAYLYRDLLRNHRYTFLISSITVPGQDTPDDAFNAVDANIGITVLDWNESDMGDVVIGGQYYLSVGRRSVNLPETAVAAPQPDSTLLAIHTDYPTWKATVYDDLAGTSQTASSQWLAVSLGSQSGSSVSGTATGALYDAADTLRFTAAANTIYTARTAYLHIVAGRTIYKVVVTQQPAILPFAYSNIYLDSNTGHLTFATEPDDTKSHFQGLFFQWGALWGISPVGAFDINTSIVFNSNPGEVPLIKDFHDMPYDSIDTSGNVVSFNDSTGIGDVCRYISSKGWVSGSWRMPTGDEFSIVEASNLTWTTGTNVSGQNDGTGPMDLGIIYAGRYFFPDTYRRATTNGSLMTNRSGSYWASDTDNDRSHSFSFVSSSQSAGIAYSTKQYGFAVRCIEDTIHPYLNVSPQSTTFTAAGGSQLFDVYTANVTGDWTYTKTGDGNDATASWLTLTSSGNKLTAVAASNTSIIARTATVTVSAPGAPDVTVTVSQAGFVASLSVSPTSYTFTAASGSHGFTVATNVASGYTFSEDVSWLSCSISGNTLTVTTDANTELNSRSATVTVSAAGATDVTLTVSQAAGSLPSGTWAYSNIYMKSDGTLTFITEPADDTTVYQYQGLFFQWGSLLGVSPAGYTSASSIVFTPAGYSGSTPTAWTNIPYTTDGESASPSVDQFTTTYGTTGYNAATGQGDICRFISAQKWVKGNWRMPKAAEYNTLYNAGSAVTGTWNAISGTNTDGTTPISQGWNLGTGTGQRFFPASGYIFTSNVELREVGTQGFYWTTSPLFDDNAFFMGILSGSVAAESSNLRQDGFPIRCVTE